MADVKVKNEGSIYLLEPTSRAGIDWVNENIGEGNGYQPMWPTVLVEHRYTSDIVAGMQADGLEVI